MAPSTWHHSSLADKRAGVDLNPGQPDLQATFNSNLNGNPACLGGRKFYLGLDNNHGADIDLVVVLLHEFAHGLGFSQFASVTTGAQTQNLSDVYGRQLLDLTTGKTWDQMTNAERAASAINSRRVVFTGPTVTAELPGVLSPGVPLLRVNSPAGIAGIYAVGVAAFGSPLSSVGIAGDVVLSLDAADAAGPLTTDGCSPLTNASAVAGKIALVDRGTCDPAMRRQCGQSWRLRELRLAPDKRSEKGRPDHRKPERRYHELRRQGRSSLMISRRRLTANIT